MDFSYIKSASSCPAPCAADSSSGSGGAGASVGPVEGDPGLPLIPGNPGIPQAPGIPIVEGNPNVDGSGPIAVAVGQGQEINCVSVELVPASATIRIGELFPFAVKVTYSNGTVGYPTQNVVFSSSDDSIATFDNPTTPQFRTDRDPDDPLLIKGILNDPLNIDHGFYIRGVAEGTVQITASYNAPSTKDPLLTAQTSNWYGACSAELTGTVTVTGNIFQSAYVWGIPYDQNPSSVLTAGQIACNDALFEIEKTMFAASLGVAIEWGVSYWLFFDVAGQYLSMALKDDAGSCDPNDPTGNRNILFANGYVRAAPYTIK